LIKITNNKFSEKLQSWYNINARDLPWRQTTNPYLIWLSEIILQQTRVAQGLPYYMRFVEEYPTILHFAQAPIDQILRLWQGLGYYSRARNMHETAQIIHKNMGGEFPPNYKELLKLKGIGTYTAAAIASFAYGENVAVLDGNVYRVLARVFGDETDISGPDGNRKFTELANSLLPATNSATHNQAIMEFGALICTPKLPHCNICTLNDLCVAYKTNTQQQLPVKSKKVLVQKRYFYYFVLDYDGKYFLKKREDKGIWQGLFDFLLVEMPDSMDIETVFLNENIAPILKNAEIQNVSNEAIHLLTHQKLHIRFVYVKLNKAEFQKENQNNFYTPNELEALPKPIVVANYINLMQQYELGFL
jgi:A/G-specific adenine glycosylase